MTAIRRARVEGRDRLPTVARYLPANYTARLDGDGVLIEGEDAHGWTLDGYVIPRLASGLIAAREVLPEPPPAERESVEWGPWGPDGREGV